MDETNYFLSFWGYFQGRHTVLLVSGFFVSGSSFSGSLGPLPSKLHCVRAPSAVAADTVTDSAAGRALSARAFRRRNFFLARTAYLPTCRCFWEILGRSWVKTCWSQKSYWRGKICHFYMFLPGILVSQLVQEFPSTTSMVRKLVGPTQNV